MTTPVMDTTQKAYGDFLEFLQKTYPNFDAKTLLIPLRIANVIDANVEEIIKKKVGPAERAVVCTVPGPTLGWMFNPNPTQKILLLNPTQTQPKPLFKNSTQTQTQNHPEKTQNNPFFK